MIDLHSCPTGRALKWNEYGTGEKGSYTDGTGCSYFYYTEYVCEESNSKDSDTTGIVTDAPTSTDTSLNEIALVSYWDVGNCGAHGGDHNWGVCRYSKFNCPEMIDLHSCPTGRALKWNEYGTGEKGSYTDGTGCSYFYYTEYVCEESNSKDSDIVTDAPTSTVCKDQPEKVMECIPGLPSAALATACRNMAEFGGCDRHITDAATTDCYVADICAETCGTCDPSDSSTQLADVIDNGLNTIVLGLAFVGVLTTFGAIIRCRQKGKYEKILDEEEI